MSNRLSTSPLISRKRLAEAMRDIRVRMKNDRGDELTAKEFAEKVASAGADVQRMDISRLENGTRRSDLFKVMACLEAAGLRERDPRYRTLVRLARQSLLKGWWEDRKFKDVKPWQIDAADVESSAVRLRHYNKDLIPWVLQTLPYMQARNRAREQSGHPPISPIQSEFRIIRQQQVLRPDGPEILVLLEETAIARWHVDSDAVPSVGQMMAQQLRHMIFLTEKYPQVKVRVLPVNARFKPLVQQLQTFTLHDYKDPDLGTAMITELIDYDILSIDGRAMAKHGNQFDGMYNAALSEQDSAAYIEKHAAEFAAGDDQKGQ